MTKRGSLLAGLVGLLLAGCAQPGTAPAGSAADGASPPVPALPTTNVAGCFDTAAKVPTAPPTTSAPPPSTTTSTRPSPTGDSPGDQFERNQQANDMFRERAQLPAAYHIAAEPCVEEVRSEFAELRAAEHYDVTSVKGALRRVGLAEAYARQPGRLDLGSGAGVVFSASPGVGCIVGYHGQESTIVEYGGPVLDGGCLVAPG